MTGRILIVDDDRRMCELLEAGLRKKGFDVITRQSASEAFDCIGLADIETVVTDLNMRGMNGLEFCERVVGSFPDVPVIVITAFGSLETAVAAIRVGAYDFLTKPFEIDELLFALDRAVQHKRLRDEVKRLRREVREDRPDDELLGVSEAMRKLRDMIGRIADSDATVLITGESGTGKELVARALHRRGRRSRGPFVAINCAAMPETLLESELFGHARGAFTDARSARNGLFVQANGGTLFLDEIGDLPLGLQPKLLRALQERVVRPLGSDTEVSFDARVIAASNRDLASAVDEGRFREDLFFRINVIHLDLPPLRARAGDVLLLAQEFIRRVCERSGHPVTGLSPQAAEKLLAYPWPGNVRELQNCIERAVTLARYDQIMVDDLPDKIRSYRRSHVLIASDDPSELVPMEEVERRYILRVMEAVAGNKTLAARILGLDRKTLYRKLERYGESQPASGSSA
ncbi:MAG TPA: sigma-54 dependent transcriptional regulator [Candidatus Binatia bacterium]